MRILLVNLPHPVVDEASAPARRAALFLPARLRA
jgi:hypothetical protein